jgi:Phosphomethylpyrimidine kinase
MHVPKALTIAGSDSGGGAGIQADLKTFSAFRVFGMSVLTAATAQNSLGVQGVFNLPPEFVARQIDSVLSDFGADAVKIGMLSTAAIAEAVAERLRAHEQKRIVVDPVMIAKSGDPLLQPDARAALIRAVLPLADVVTPNLHEASALAEMPVDSEADMEEAARRILALRPGSIRRTPTGPVARSPRRSPPGWPAAVRWATPSGRPRPTSRRPSGRASPPGKESAPSATSWSAGRRWCAPSTTRCRSWSTWASCARASSGP